MSLATPRCVQKLQTASHASLLTNEACVFSESRMREICLSGSMSGNRKQNQAKPDCGGAAKATSNIRRETTVTAPVLDSTLYFTHRRSNATTGVPCRALSMDLDRLRYGRLRI